MLMLHAASSITLDHGYDRALRDLSAVGSAVYGIRMMMCSLRRDLPAGGMHERPREGGEFQKPWLAGSLCLGLYGALGTYLWRALQ